MPFVDIAGRVTLRTIAALGIEDFEEEDSAGAVVDFGRLEGLLCLAAYFRGRGQSAGIVRINCKGRSHACTEQKEREQEQGGYRAGTHLEPDHIASGRPMASALTLLDVSDLISVQRAFLLT